MPLSAAPLTCRNAARMRGTGNELVAAIESACAAVQSKTPTDEPTTLGMDSAWLGVEIWYLHSSDWELRPHELVSQKGTWLKASVCSSAQKRCAASPARRLKGLLVVVAMVFVLDIDSVVIEMK